MHHNGFIKELIMCGNVHRLYYKYIHESVIVIKKSKLTILILLFPYILGAFIY